MDLRGFVFAPGCQPFRSLRAFSGKFIENVSLHVHTNASQLFRLCPALTDVVLFGLYDISSVRLPAGPAPDCLMRLSFQSADSHSVNYLAFCESLNLLPQDTSLFGCSTFIAAFTLWSTHVRAPYAMRWARVHDFVATDDKLQHHITLTSDEDAGPIFTFTVHESIVGSANLSGAVPHMGQLAYLTCAIEKFHDLLAAHPVLPALASLTLVLSNDGRYADAHIRLARYGTLRATQLQTLQIDTQALDRDGARAALGWCAQLLPREFEWLDFGRRRLASARFYRTGETRSVHGVGPDMGALLMYADAVYVGPCLHRGAAVGETGPLAGGSWFYPSRATSR
ncbi:hypothetical protein AURDEDRAFT_128852 [Auricularia subglabra TFB-10046 SS5]|nr:hypothetical protein AURDEDRAFT_128852 [Auricularia subglabra TFB-10046 SS5]